MLDVTARIKTTPTSAGRTVTADRLNAAARTQGAITTGIPEVLFVCVHNAGRSHMAAALLHHHARSGPRSLYARWSTRLPLCSWIASLRLVTHPGPMLRLASVMVLVNVNRLLNAGLGCEAAGSPIDRGVGVAARRAERD
jgi:hypothetical protein